MKIILLLLCVLFSISQAPKMSMLEKDKGVGDYRLGTARNAKLPLKLTKKSGNTSEYAGPAHLQINGVEVLAIVSPCFYKGKLMSFTWDVKDPHKARVLYQYLQSRYGKGIRDEYNQRTDGEVSTWSSPTVTLEVLLNKKTGAGWFYFTSNPLLQLWQKDPTTEILSEIP